MSAKYTFLAWDTPIENAPLKLALLQLANNADDDGFSYYSISKMAVSCGMSEKTFQRKIAEMEKMGILTVSRRSNRTSLYTLVGDEMGVTLCRLQDTEATESLGTATESLLLSDRESHDLNNTPTTTPESIDNKLYLFDVFWDAYDKKKGRPKCEGLWKKLKGDEIELIFDNLPKYVLSTPVKQYRSNPETWLRNKGWNDEVIINEQINANTTSSGRKESSHERIKRENDIKYRGGRSEQGGLVMGANDGHLGRAVGEGEREQPIARLDNQPFIDY
jgi:hypothetical protein